MNRLPKQGGQFKLRGMRPVSKPNNKLIRYPLQALNYTLFMAMTWYLSAAPPFEHLAKDQAVVTLTFAHVGQHIEACHKLSQEELNKLPPNMRKLEECGRERSPVQIEVEMDGQPIFSEKAEPPGIYNDGSISIFISKRVPVGPHQFSIKMNDSIHVEGFNFNYEESVELEPAQLLVIGFNTSEGFTLE